MSANRSLEGLETSSNVKVHTANSKKPSLRKYFIKMPLRKHFTSPKLAVRSEFATSANYVKNGIKNIKLLVNSTFFEASADLEGCLEGFVDVYPPENQFVVQLSAKACNSSPDTWF